MNRAVKAIVDEPGAPGAAELPPEADITSPGWFAEIDPSQPSIDVSGTVFARGESYRCRVLVAPGQYPNNATTASRRPVTSGRSRTAGATARPSTGAPAAPALTGALGSIDVSALRRASPRRPTSPARSRPPRQPPATAVRSSRPTRSRSRSSTPTTGAPRTGEDQRTAWLHRDGDLLNGFPRTIGAVGLGPARPRRRRSVVAGLRRSRRRQPQRADLRRLRRLRARDRDRRQRAAGLAGSRRRARLRLRARRPPAYSGGVSTDLGGAFLGAVAVGDPDDDGIPEVYAADVEGKVYGWGPAAARLHRGVEPGLLGQAAGSIRNVRNGKTNRTQHGFFGAPVLADLDGDGRDEVIAASMDRHVYAWKADDSDPGAPGGAADSPGYPVLVVDPAKVAAVDPQTHAVTFAAPTPGMQGAIIDTPAVGDITGDGCPRSSSAPTRNTTRTSTPAAPGGLGRLLGAGLLTPATRGSTRCRPTAATTPTRCRATPSSRAGRSRRACPDRDAADRRRGHRRPAGDRRELPGRGRRTKIGVTANDGPAYVLNADGTSCYGETSGKPNALSADSGARPGDHPAADPRSAIRRSATSAARRQRLLAPGASGVQRRSTSRSPSTRSGQDLLGVWDPATGQFRSGFPATVNDLQLLTGPAVADIDGDPGEEILAGSASQDLVACGPPGTPASGWPKLTTDWTVATPLIGTFGTVDTEAGPRRSSSG